MEFFWSKQFSLTRRAIAIALIFLHIAAFGPINDALADVAASLNYRLQSSSINEGGSGKGSLNNKIQLDSAGEPFIGAASSLNYRLSAGFIPTLIYNSPPVLIRQIAPISWDIGTDYPNAFDLDDYFQDPEGDALQYSFSGNNRIVITINQENLVSFSQPADFLGSETVRFIAEDSAGNIVYSNDVTLQVSPTPLIAPIDEIRVSAGTEITISPQILNPREGDHYAFNFSYPLTDWEMIGENTWRVPPGHGNYIYERVSVQLVDSVTAEVYHEQYFRIIVERVNRIPRFVSINGINVSGQDVELTANEGELFTISPVVEDLDTGDTIVYSFVPRQNEQGKSAAIESDGRWQTTYNDAGVYIVTIVASDGFADVSQDVQITVLNVSLLPEVSVSLNRDPYVFLVNESFDIMINAYDPEGRSMTYTILKNGTEIASGTAVGAEFSVTTNAGSAVSNNETIQVKIETDDGRSVLSDIIHFNVVEPDNKIRPIGGDFNGDGLSDLGLYNPEDGKWEIGLSEAGEVRYVSDWLTGFGGEDWIAIGGDFNGDGVGDAGVYNYKDGKLKIATSTKSSFTGASEWAAFSEAGNDWAPLTGNFNGDAFTDFGVYNWESGEARVALGNGSGFSGFTQWISGFGSSKEWTPLVGDFNGDSLADICIFKKTSGEFRVALSNNRQFLDRGTWLSGFSVKEDAFVADFNNDGLTDVGYLPEGGSDWHQAINTGSAFNGDSGVWINYSSSKDQSPTTLDINGDGIADAALYDKKRPGLQRWSVRTSTGRPADLLVEVNNGKGGLVSVEYDYTRQDEKLALPFPLYITRQVTTTDTIERDYYPNRSDVGFDVDRSNSYTQEFKFEQGYYDAVEREFRGFGKVTSIDPVTLNYTQTYFYLGEIEETVPLKGQIKEIYAYEDYGRSITPKLVSKVINTWEVAKAGPQDGIAFPHLKEVLTTAYEKYEDTATSITLKSGFEYDGLGNVAREISYGEVGQAGSEIEGQTTGDEREGITVYNAPYEVGFNNVHYAVLKDEQGIQVSRKDFEYYDDGLLKKEIAWLNTDPQDSPSTEYQYDDYGNVIRAINANLKAVDTAYETEFYTFPQSISNELGHTVSYSYYPEFGAVHQLTDANGHTTTTNYDSLGRLVEELNTDAEVVAAYEYPDFKTKITRQLNLVTTEHFDGLGRKYKAVSNGEDGDNRRDIATETYYNRRGFVQAESLPHYFDEQPANISYTRYEYDLRSRAVSVTADFPGSSKDATARTFYKTVSYVETEDARGNRKGAVKDVFGNTTEIREFVRNTDNMEAPLYFDSGRGYYRTQYQFDSQNNLVRVIDNKGNTTDIKYDSLGRKSSLNDPDTGLTSYEYDKMGNLRFQTDNKGQAIELRYDELNRLRQKIYNGEVAAEYLYDTYDDPQIDDSNCIGRITKVTDVNEYQTIYFYDNEGRTEEARKIIDGHTYVTKTAYDILGRVTEVQYPDDTETLSYTYDSNSGLLEMVRGRERAYAYDITYDAQGKMHDVDFGNRVHTRYAYGDDLRLKEINTYSPDRLIQKLTYDFDNNGNVASISDEMLPDHKTRAYRYDDLDRLVAAENIPDPQFPGTFRSLEYRYDSIGNMTYKSDVGALRYDGNLPHAVTSAGQYSYIYDLNGNMTSGAGRNMEYDYDNRLTEITDAQGSRTNFVYGVSTERIKKISAGSTTTYFSSAYEIEETTGGERAVKFHVFLGSNRICTITNGQRIYYHSDHLGSSNVITNQSGETIERNEYTPYGSFAKQTSVESATNYHFTGKELDSFGLYYYGARYYDPYIGRFITPDPTIQHPYDPQDLNRYAYCRNNPINYVDPSGYGWFKKFWQKISGFVAAIVGTVVGIATGNPFLGMATYSLIAASSQRGNFAQNFGIGFASSLVGFGIGAGVGAVWGGGFWSGLAASALGGAGAGAAASAMLGGDVGLGALAGFAGGTIGYIGGSVWPLGAEIVAGGVSAEILGGDFGEGAREGGLHSLGQTVGGILATPTQSLGEQNLEGGDVVFFKPDSAIGWGIALFEGGIFSHTGIMLNKTEMAHSTWETGTGIVNIEKGYSKRQAYVSNRFRRNQYVIDAAKSLAKEKITYGMLPGQYVCSTFNSAVLDKSGYPDWYGIGPNSQVRYFQ
ncbi:MAG: toxin TcdB middle/N-terminal domain-containing protein [Candidatus Omnitrophica bacterium]|nr:toxin TcdB middle/N-terminal domain-containing protein [Candidatus Omnitrophota bacterium]